MVKYLVIFCVFIDFFFVMIQWAYFKDQIKAFMEIGKFLSLRYLESSSCPEICISTKEVLGVLDLRPTSPVLLAQL